MLQLLWCFGIFKCYKFYGDLAYILLIWLLVNGRPYTLFPRHFFSSALVQLKLPTPLSIFLISHFHFKLPQEFVLILSKTSPTQIQMYLISTSFQIATCYVFFVGGLANNQHKESLKYFENLGYIAKFD